METVWLSPLFRATCPKLLPAKAGLASARAAREIHKAFDPLMVVEPLSWTGSPMVPADVSARSARFNLSRGGPGLPAPAAHAAPAARSAGAGDAAARSSSQRPRQASPNSFNP